MKRLLAALLLCAPLSAAWPRAGGGGGGGCFAAGTLVATTAGGIPIEQVEKDNVVLAYSEGRIMQVPVRRAYKEKSRRLVLYTAAGSVTTTAEHPFLTRNGFVEAGDLKVGDDIGRLAEGRLAWTRITRLRARGSVDVYNLEVAPPHTFIANGFVVHNKGGGGGGGGRGGRGSRTGNLLTLIILGPIVLFLKLKELFFGGGSAASERTLPRDLVEQRAAQVTDILRSLAEREPALSPRLLETEMRGIFISMQDAWSRRDYSPLRERIAPELYARHVSQLDNMLAKGEKNVMDNVQVKGIDFVHVRYTGDPAERSVTALISASACDYTVDDNSGAVIRGSRLPSSFQEFWTFRPVNGRWVPSKIHQTSEDYLLTAPNLPAEPLRPGLNPPAASAPAAIAGAAVALSAAAALPAAAAAKSPAPLPPEAAKAARFDRPDDPWDRQRMEIAATLTFMDVYGAWEKGHAADINAEGIATETLKKTSSPPGSTPAPAARSPGTGKPCTATKARSPSRNTGPSRGARTASGASAISCRASGRKAATAARPTWPPRRCSWNGTGASKKRAPACAGALSSCRASYLTLISIGTTALILPASTPCRPSLRRRVSRNLCSGLTTFLSAATI